MRVISRASSPVARVNEHPRDKDKDGEGESRPRGTTLSRARARATVNVPEGSELYIYFYACVNAGLRVLTCPAAPIFIGADIATG